jgi:hypothetical protein
MPRLGPSNHAPRIQSNEGESRLLLQALDVSNGLAVARLGLYRRGFRLELSFGDGDCVFVWAKQRELFSV